MLAVVERHHRDARELRRRHIGRPASPAAAAALPLRPAAPALPAPALALGEAESRRSDDARRSNEKLSAFHNGSIFWLGLATSRSFCGRSRRGHNALT